MHRRKSVSKIHSSFLSTFNSQPILLPLVFALAEFFIDLEAGFLRVREGDRLELLRRAEAGDDFAHRLFARRAMRERLGRQRPVQGEFPAADLAVAFAQFVFVKWHELKFEFRFCCNEISQQQASLHHRENAVILCHLFFRLLHASTLPNL